MITHREEIRKNSFKLPKGNGQFYRPFSFLLFSKNFSKSVDKHGSRYYNNKRKGDM